MIFDDKRIKEILDKYIKKYPKYYAYHLQSKLSCLRYEQQVRRCAKIIPKNARVLDLGCGLGQTSVILSIIRPDLKIIGVDIKREPVWKKLNKFKCKFKVCDALNLRFKNNTFDAVISFGVMEHTKDDKKFLNEIYRVLKKGGINLIFNLPNRYSLNEFAAKILEACHKKRYTTKQTKRLLMEEKFKDIKIKRESFLPAQINEVSKFWGKVFNKYYILLDKIDKFLVKTPLNFFAEAYFIVCRK